MEPLDLMIACIGAGFGLGVALRAVDVLSRIARGRG